MVAPALEIRGLKHQYKGAEEPTISNLNLTVSLGESFGLFGPNGAGKTTLISLITGAIPLKEGTIRVFGKELQSSKKEVLSSFGYVPQSISLYEELSPIQNLKYFGAMLGLTPKEIDLRSAELLAILGLENVAKKQISKFSGGMKRRVNLAIGVIHKPKLLFLDEPTVGVDVQTRSAIIEYLKSLNAEGTTLFYTSHHMAEAQELCNEVSLIDGGKILTSGKLENLLQEHSESTLEALFLKLTGKAYRD